MSIFVFQIGWDWPQIGQFWDFFRSDFSTVWLVETNVNPGIFQIRSRSQNALKSDLKKSQNCPIWDQSEPLLVKIPDLANVWLENRFMTSVLKSTPLSKWIRQRQAIASIDHRRHFYRGWKYSNMYASLYCYGLNK